MMFDTYITIVGTALNTPEKRVVAKTNAVVSSFRVASHARRFNRETQEWVDGASFRIRVNCWRRLADNICGSVHSGDPVVVTGRISTRDWVNEQGETRIAYELDADSVGHDLSRGTAAFTKIKPESFGTVVEDTENRVNGEPTIGIGPLAEAGVGHQAVDPLDDFSYGDAPESEDDALAILRGAGLEPSEPGDDDSDDLTDDEAMVGSAASGSGARGRRRGRQPVPA
jgi:single-strand DNA-binding protein